jgi:hypothetical protein
MSRTAHALGVALFAGIVSCSAPAGTVSETPSPSVSGSASGTCLDTPLRFPDGSRVNLGGAWSMSDTTIAYVYQSGACVWWAGGFATSETAAVRQFDGLGRMTIVFRGEVASDFTVSGDWSVVRGGASDRGRPQRTWGTVTMKIDWDGKGETITLEPLSFTGSPLPFGTMTKVSDEDIPPP